MAYTPINWQTGDTITAEKLNRCDNGWGVGITQLFSETVTTATSEYGNEGTLAYAELVTSQSINVTFDGTDYTCPLVIVSGGFGYGGVNASWEYEFTTYPFALVFSSEGNYLATESTGTYALSVSIIQVETSSNFASAVNSVVEEPSSVPMECVPAVTTYQEMRAARDANRLMYAYLSRRNCVLINSVPDDASGIVGYYPTSGSITLQFDGNGILIAES